jgi:hypothetical protein
MKKYGDRQAVYEGQAEMTKGGLRKDDLTINARGKIVSKKRSALSSKVFSEYKGRQNKKVDL